MTREQADWHERRDRAVAGHAAALAAECAADAARAADLLADFVRRAGERRLRPTLLSARSVGGRATYRTRLQGWYLKADGSVAVGTDGLFYVLSVAPSWRARLTGAVVQPSTPRLVIGAGGGDGETMPLELLLQRRLKAGDRP